MKRVPIRDILWVFVLTRLLLVLVTYFGYILLTAEKYSSTPVDVVALFTSWNHWDAANYVRIAQFGYGSKFDLAFFPLYPLLISGFGHLLGDWAYLASGMVISNIALLALMIVMYELAVDMGGEKVARRSVLYLCIFPAALFFFTAYNESLFILLIAGAFLAMRRQRWWLAGLLGFFAALTRNAGVLIVVPYLYELWMSRERIMASRRNFVFGVFPIALVPLGVVLYAGYCWLVSGDPLAFASVQSHWARSLSWPWQGIWQALFELFWNQPFGSFNQAHVLLDLSATLGFLALTVMGWRKLRMSYNLWIVVLFLYILLGPSLGQHDPLISNKRFMLELFPAFFTLAMLSIRYPRLHQTLMLIFPTLLAILSILFVMNRWMV